MTNHQQTRAHRLRSRFIESVNIGFFASLLNHRHVQYYIAPILFIASALPLCNIYLANDTWGGARELVSAIVQHGIVFVLLAVGASVVISTSQIDLSSVGVSIMSGVLFGLVLSYGPNHYSTMWTILAVVTSLLFSALSGAVVAFCFTRFRVPLLIFTWAVGSSYAVIAILLTNATGPSSTYDVSGISLPWRSSPEFWRVGHSGFVSALLVIILAIIVIEGINLRRRAAALGASEVSAEYAGVSRTRTYAECFIVNGILAGCAGIFHTFFLSQASVGDLPGKELIPIAVCVLGGTSLAGGYLSLWSVICAGLFWTEASLLGPHLPRLFPFLRGIEAELGQILFYAIFVLIAFTFGKLLSPRFYKHLSVREISR